MWFGKELLILGLACLLGKCQGNCGIGLSKEGKKCVDTNECEENPSLCGNHSRCFNTYGSYYCQCITGFINERGGFNFTASDGQCQDINECRVNRNICGSWAHCTNRIGGYDCTCNLGYVSISNGQCKGEVLFRLNLLSVRPGVSNIRPVGQKWPTRGSTQTQERNSDINCSRLFLFHQSASSRSFREDKTCRRLLMCYLWCQSQEINESVEVSYICAYWNEGGFWATDGCHEDISNATHTSCLCKHLSSFAVLMALYPMEPNFGLQLVTKIGLTLSLLCLIVCILTFKFCRSIQGTRTTIHLHLCICLFMADLIFLVGISQTKPEGGCRLVAGLLHFFFLGMFTWMLLEGVQLYRMVVLVFNATIRPLYLYVTGYGIPLIVVILSASIRPKGYGTELYCWLSLQDGLIWSFFGPVCIIILLNVVFFIVTVWKLAQKFTSLNPDLSKLHKIRAFTVTAVAQMCILGLMWVFGAFLFQKDAIVVPYIFTILNSLQGALVFIMHCLLSKQVRDEYAHFLSCICTPEKKRYSDFSSTNPSSSQSRVSKD
uniref:Adhesion G protein-coupled receptor E5b, duplicate 3 n=1 Tax=Salarias fasciatus TaxID=181472 RepID=A0A672HXS2_SALFA